MIITTCMIPWYGSKRLLRGRIVAELGPHKVYWEPAVGGCSIICEKPRASHETLNDLHWDLTNLLRVVQDDQLGPQLFERLLRTVCSDDAMGDANFRMRMPFSLGTDNIAADLERAIAYFTWGWMGRNGEMGLQKNERGRKIAVRWSGNGGSPGMRWQSAVDSLPGWWERLRGVAVTRRCLFKLLEEIRDEAGTAIYLDPPYIEKSDEYLHDFVTYEGIWPDDHRRMADVVRRFKKARVVVSYYAHPRLAELYPRDLFTHVDCARTSLRSRGAGGPKLAPEVLIVNGPSLTEEHP